MTTVDMTNLENRKWAVETGVIWSAPTGAQVQACKDIANGIIPMPAKTPPAHALNYINHLKALQGQGQGGGNASS